MPRTQKVRDKKIRVAKDISESLPVAVICLGQGILILACSKDHRRRIKRALHRIATINFGSDGFALQRRTSQEAKSMLGEVSYENVSASVLSDRIAEILSYNLKHPHRPEISAALVVVRLDCNNPQGDEVVLLPYDGNLQFVGNFFSGLDLSGSDEEVPQEGVLEKDSAAPEEEKVAQHSPLQEKKKIRKRCMGRAVPKFEEFFNNPSDGPISIFDIVELFGNECAELFGEDIYIQCAELEREAAAAQRFEDVFLDIMHGPWPAIKEALTEMKKGQEATN